MNRRILFFVASGLLVLTAWAALSAPAKPSGDKLGSHWMMTTDQIQGGASRAIVAIVAGHAHRKGALEVSGTVKSNGKISPWAGVMYSPGIVGLPVNISNDRTLRFWVKGDGKPITLALFDATRGYANGSFLVCPTTAAWSPVAVPLSAFAGSDLRTVTSIGFMRFSEEGPFRFALDGFALDTHAVAEAGVEQPFDNRVRDDFFSGDPGRLRRAMKVAENVLKKRPDDAEALVWHGSGLLDEAEADFAAKRQQQALPEWLQGMSEMDRSVALEPHNPAVLIPRAATLLYDSRYVPDPSEQRAELNKVVSDYGFVYGTQKPFLAKIDLHQRGELLFGLAEAYSRLGDQTDATARLNDIKTICAGTPYATEAGRWLTTPAQKPSDRYHTCIGCHG